MSGPERLTDADDRLVATTRFDANLVVVAGAGTGKTSLLVERLLVAIGRGTITLDRLAAITFTVKAASEMRERLASELERLRSSADGEGDPDLGTPAGRALDSLRATERDRDVSTRVHDALDRIDTATITTIDAFCGEVLRRYPVEAGLDPAFRVDRGDLSDARFDVAWPAFLARELGPDARRPALWTALLDRVPLSSIEAAARELVRYRVPEGALRSPYAALEAARVFGEDIRALLARAEPLVDPSRGLTAIQREYLAGLRALADALLVGGPSALMELASCKGAADLAKIKVSGSRKVPPDANDAYKEVAESLRALLAPLSAVDEEACRCIHEAVAPFALAFRDDALASGEIDFEAVLTLTRDLLRDYPAVRDDLKRRLGMILVDEFQDTDPVQYEIVLFLGERLGDAARDPYSARLEPGRLFVVGDPKQSIYRFRGADYAAFRAAVGKILADGGRELRLRANFRSSPEVLAPVNRLFERPADGVWRPSCRQPDYLPVIADARRAAGRPCVEFWRIDPPPGAKGDEVKLAEARAVAGRIVHMREVGEIRDYGEVMLLLRARTPLATYLRAFREAGVPFVVEGGRTFLERPEVAQFLALLRVIARPSDEAALLAVLRSPAGGVSDAEMAAWVVSSGRLTLSAEPDPARFPVLARALERLRELASRVRDLPVDAVVRVAARESGWAPLAAFGFEGPQRVANLRHLVGVACGMAREGALTLNDVLDRIEAARDERLEGDPPLTDEGEDAVRISTIHKAKGLERRVVILANLSREEVRHRRAATVRWVSPFGSPALAMAVEGATNTAAVAFGRDEELHEEAEEIRLLYVALTRARDRLVLVARPDRGRSPWIEAIAPWGIATVEPGTTALDGTVVVTAVAGERRADTGRTEASFSGATEVAAWTQRVVEAAAAARRDAFEAASETTDDTAILGGSPLARPVARAVGTAVHRWLESWTPGSASSLGDVGALAEDAAREHGSDSAAVAHEARAILEAFLASPLARRLDGASIVAREMPVLWREPEVLHRGRIDLLYRDAGGALVVADFKTDTDEEGASARYAAQLAVYAKAVRGAAGPEAAVRAELWMLRSGRALSVEIP